MNVKVEKEFEGVKEVIKESGKRYDGWHLHDETIKSALLSYSMEECRNHDEDKRLDEHEHS